MLKKSIFTAWTVVILIALTFSMVTAQESDQYNDESGNLIIEAEKVSERDFLFAGSNVTVNSIFDTTTFFAGNTISLDGEYNGDLFVAGNNVTINGKINGNLYATGNVVILNGSVSQDVFAGCSDFTVSSTADVKRDVFVASANASFGGNIGRNLRVGAGNMILNGRVGGFVKTDVDQLTINDNAEVLGSIDHRSGDQAIVSEKASVPELNWEKITASENSEETETTGIGTIIFGLITKFLFILVMWLLLTFVSRDFSENMRWMVKKHLWASLGLGAAYLFLTPIILFLAFVVYVPFGVAMTLLIIASFILAMPIAAVTFSKLLIRIFEQKMKPLLASFIAILCLAVAIILIGLIPYLGAILSFFMMIFGLGFLIYNSLFAKRQLKKEKNLQVDDYEKIRRESQPVTMDNTKDLSQSNERLVDTEALNEKSFEKK